MSMMSLATWAALPTSVWMRMYAVTTGTDLLASCRPRRPAETDAEQDGGMRRPGPAITLRQDGVDRWFAWRGLAGVPGFAPHQPIPSGPEVSVAVRLTCWFTVTGCYDVQVKCAP